MEMNNSTINFNLSISKTDILQYFGTILITFVDNTYDWLETEMSIQKLNNKDVMRFKYYYWKLMRKSYKNDTLTELRNFLDDSRNKRCLIKYQDFIESMVKDDDLRFFAEHLDLTTYCRYKHKCGFLQLAGGGSGGSFCELADGFDITVSGSDDYWTGESIKANSMFPIGDSSEYDDINIEFNDDKWITQRDITPHKTIIEIIETNTRSFVWEYLNDANLGDCQYEIPLCMEYDCLWIWKPNLFSDLPTTKHRLENFNNLVADVCDNIGAELNLDGAFYTEYLDEKATIIQRCWIRSRYNYKYKIARKYINEGIKELEDEIGLVLVD